MHKLEYYFTLIRNDGSRVSTALKQVVSHLYESEQAHTINELHSCLCTNGVSIGLPTLYRVIDKLCELELAFPVILQGKEIRYFLCKEPCQKEHHHFICVHCHRIEEVDFSIEESCSTIVSDTIGGRLTGCTVQLEGLCKSCKER